MKWEILLFCGKQSGINKGWNRSLSKDSGFQPSDLDYQVDMVSDGLMMHVAAVWKYCESLKAFFGVIHIIKKTNTKKQTLNGNYSFNKAQSLKN